MFFCFNCRQVSNRCCCGQGDLKIEKNCPMFEKSSQNNCQNKFSTSKLYLKVQNIYIKPLYNLKISVKICFKTPCFGKKCKNVCLSKKYPNCDKFLAPKNLPGSSKSVSNGEILLNLVTLLVAVEYFMTALLLSLLLLLEL